MPTEAARLPTAPLAGHTVALAQIAFRVGELQVRQIVSAAPAEGSDVVDMYILAGEGERQILTADSTLAVNAREELASGLGCSDTVISGRRAMSAYDPDPPTINPLSYLPTSSGLLPLPLHEATRVEEEFNAETNSCTQEHEQNRVNG